MLDVSAGLELRVGLEMTRGKLPQVTVDHRFPARQVAASCRKLPCMASCRMLPQVAASCRGTAHGKLPQVTAAERAASRGKLP